MTLKVTRTCVCSGLPPFPLLKLSLPISFLSHKLNTERTNSYYFLRIKLILGTWQIPSHIFFNNTNRKPLMTQRTNVNRKI